MNKPILCDPTFNFACLSVFTTSSQVAVQKALHRKLLMALSCRSDVPHVNSTFPSSHISHTSLHTLLSTHLSLVHKGNQVSSSASCFGSAPLGPLLPVCRCGETPQLKYTLPVWLMFYWSVED